MLALQCCVFLVYLYAKVCNVATEVRGLSSCIRADKPASKVNHFSSAAAGSDMVAMMLIINRLVFNEVQEKSCFESNFL